MKDVYVSMGEGIEKRAMVEILYNEVKNIGRRRQEFGDMPQDI